MRVLHVVPMLTGGGGERLVATLVEHLRALGVEIGVMTIYPSEVPFPPDRDIPVIPINKGRADVAFIGRMVGAMRKWRPTIVHTHLGLWGRVAAAAAGVPIIVHTEHNPSFEEGNTVARTLAYHALTKRTSVFITLLQYWRRYLATIKHVPPEKIVVIGNGIAHHAPPSPAERAQARKRLGIGPHEFALFMVASLQPVKNQQLAIKAVSDLRSTSYGKVKLFLLGAGTEEAGLRELALRLKVADGVAFCGYRNDVPELLPGADLFLMTSHSEGMPLAMLEAMSAGVPVLTTPWPGANELLEDGRLGTLLLDWSTNGVAAAVEALLKDLTPARDRAAGAQVAVRTTYDLGRIAALHKELYEELAQRDAQQCLA
jgi:L-malate glycosyltransferase